MNRTDKQIRTFFKQNAPIPGDDEGFLSKLEMRLDESQTAKIRSLLEAEKKANSRSRNRLTVAFVLGMAVGAAMICLAAYCPEIMSWISLEQLQLSQDAILEADAVTFAAVISNWKTLLLLLVPIVAIGAGLYPILKRR